MALSDRRILENFVRDECIIVLEEETLSDKSLAYNIVITPNFGEYGIAVVTSVAALRLAFPDQKTAVEAYAAMAKAV